LYDLISERYTGRAITINVSEDNENGCRIYYPAKLEKID